MPETKEKTETKKPLAKAKITDTSSKSKIAKSKKETDAPVPIKKQDTLSKSSKPKLSKLEELKKKAAALESKVEDASQESLKEKVKLPVSPEEQEEKKETFVPMEDYLKSSIHLGTRVITPDMRSYVYRRRADGLAVFNTAKLDTEIIKGAEYLSKFSPEKIMIVCKREAGWKAVKLFSQITGIKVFTKKFPPGILTNTNLDNFIERDLVFICDPWIDKNALNDANKIRVPVLSICDTNNYTKGISTIIPGNNKSAKSLGMIFYILAKIYVEKQKLDTKVPGVEEFIDDWENLQPPK